jgi:hypothetical protein
MTFPDSGPHLSRWLERYFAEVSHRPGPESFETIRKSLRQSGIAHHERCYAPLGNEWMIDRQDDKFFIDDVERVSKLAGIANSGDMVEVGPLLFQKRNQLGCGAIPEAEHNTMIDPAGHGVPGDAPE